MADVRKYFYKSYRTLLNINKETDRISKYSWACAYGYYIKPIELYNNSCRILDVGCGGGKIIELQNFFWYKNVFGVDISEEQIAFAKNI